LLLVPEEYLWWRFTAVHMPSSVPTSSIKTAKGTKKLKALKPFRKNFPPATFFLDHHLTHEGRGYGTHCTPAVQCQSPIDVRST